MARVVSVHSRPVHSPGRPPGRPLTDDEVRILQLLLQLHGRASGAAAEYTEQLEDTILEFRERGVSVRGIATALDMSPTQVQRWTSAARDRRFG